MQQTASRPVNSTTQHPSLSIQPIPIHTHENAARATRTTLLMNALSLQENQTPSDIAQNNARNQELFRLFNEAQHAYNSQEDCADRIGSIFLWKKLGQSFYPGCAQSP